MDILKLLFRLIRVLPALVGRRLHRARLRLQHRQALARFRPGAGNIFVTLFHNFGMFFGHFFRLYLAGRVRFVSAGGPMLNTAKHFMLHLTGRLAS